MNIFTEVDGKKSENFSSAVLRYLMLTSIECREALIGVISNKSETGPIDCISHFSCEVEVTTKSEEKEGENTNPGRLDILVSTDDAVIGIENKIFADFQVGQPEKYMSTVQNRAEHYGQIYKKNYRMFMVILLPKERVKKVKKDKISKLSESERHGYIIVSWEELLLTLDSIARLDNRSDFIVHLFKEYMCVFWRT